jgi:aryl-alcohol dehydrogenase-like predicted oxidoreductase
MSKTKIGLGLAALGRPEYINIRMTMLMINPRKLLLRMLLVFLILLTSIRYFDTAPSYGKGEEFLINWNSKYQYKDVNLSTRDIPMWQIGN